MEVLWTDGRTPGNAVAAADVALLLLLLLGSSREGGKVALLGRKRTAFNALPLLLLPPAAVSLAGAWDGLLLVSHRKVSLSLAEGAEETSIPSSAKWGARPTEIKKTTINAIEAAAAAGANWWTLISRSHRVLRRSADVGMEIMNG